jgi:hypothetical protein
MTDKLLCWYALFLEKQHMHPTFGLLPYSRKKNNLSLHLFDSLNETQGLGDVIFLHLKMVLSEIQPEE